MKLTFKQFTEQNIARQDLLVFTPEYEENKQQILTSLVTGTQRILRLGRLIGYEFVLEEKSNMYSIIHISSSKIEVQYVAPGTDFLTQKTIRMDNVLGEILVMPDFYGKQMIKLNKMHHEYFTFVQEVRKGLAESIGKMVTLTYQNDDGSVSVIDTRVLEVNRGNFKCTDSREIHRTGNVLHSNGLYQKTKNHRFISQNGFLSEVLFSEAEQPPYSQHDDGCVLEYYETGLTT